MNNYIKKLQGKTEESRKLIFTTSLIVFMSVIVMIWVYGLGNHFVKPEIKEQAREDIKPFKLFSNSISSTYKSMSASVGRITSKKDDVKAVEKEINLIPIENSIQ